MELIGDVILHDPVVWPDMDWKTHFARDPNIEEPIAFERRPDVHPRYAPQVPLTQEQMREQFDQSRMVQWQPGGGYRRQREHRHQVMLAKMRVFTEHFYEAMTMEYT